MAGLFDMPSVRSNKEADKVVAVKSKTKSASAVTTRGNSIIDRITLIKQTVETKLGKYKDLYSVITKEYQLENYIDMCIKDGIMAIDTETTGLDVYTDKIAGLCLYTPSLFGTYIPINHESYITGLKCEEQLTTGFISTQLKRLKDNNVKIIMHNANFDIRVIKQATGVSLSCYFDTLIASQLLNENEPHGLKALHQKYVLNGEGDAWSFGKLFDGIAFTKIPINIAYMYAARDPHITYELYKFQLPYMTLGTKENTEQSLEKVQEVFWNIEMPYIDVIVDMEDTGINIDLEYANKLHDKYSAMKQDLVNKFNAEIDKIHDKIDIYNSNVNNSTSQKLLELPININSPQQLAILFYDILDIGVIDKKLPRGTGEKILLKLDIPIAKMILDYRTVDKLISTYIDKLPLCLKSDDKIHCQFNQYGAKTGRLSSEDPNLQNIPSHNKDIRKMFVAPDDFVLLSSDFSQQEPKAMAAMCKDEGMIQAYIDGKDLYAQIASASFSLPYEQCLEHFPKGSYIKNYNGVWKYGTKDNYDKISDGTDVYQDGKERRTSAKSILLGILYGRSLPSVAEQLNVSVKEAQLIQDKIFKGFPAIKKFEEDTLVMAETLGYVTTFWGRKRRLPEMQLPTYQFEYLPGHGDFDPLSFDATEDLTVPYNVQQNYINKLESASRRGYIAKLKIIEDAEKTDGIKIIDNEITISDTTRQCVNARIQGSAADMSKKAGIIIRKNERLKELGFKLVIPIHDEYLGICPIENAKECADLFSKCMCEAAVDMNIPMKTDVTISKCWYGEEIEL